MFLPRVQLLADKRPARLPQDPLLRQLVRGWVIPDLHAWRERVDVFDEVVVEEGDAAFDGVGHFGAVGEVGEEEVWESGFVPEVLGRVEGVPFLGHFLAGEDGDGFDHGGLRGEGTEVGVGPGGEGKVGEGHCVGEGGDGGGEVGGDGGAVVACPG